MRASQRAARKPASGLPTTIVEKTGYAIQMPTSVIMLGMWPASAGSSQGPDDSTRERSPSPNVVDCVRVAILEPRQQSRETAELFGR